MRQRLTELGLTYLVHQVPVERDERTKLADVTGQLSIPVRVDGGDIVEGEQAILDYLDGHFTEPPDAQQHRAKAAKAKQKELEKACPKLAAATH